RPQATAHPGPVALVRFGRVHGLSAEPRRGGLRADPAGPAAGGAADLTGFIPSPHGRSAHPLVFLQTKAQGFGKVAKPRGSSKHQRSLGLLIASGEKETPAHTVGRNSNLAGISPPSAKT